MMAFVVPGVGGREVVRAKKLMSAFMRGQGSVPLRPMPRRVGREGSCWSCWARAAGVDDATRIGVVATMRVRGRECGFVGGIFFPLVLLCSGRAD